MARVKGVKRTNFKFRRVILLQPILIAEKRKTEMKMCQRARRDRYTTAVGKGKPENVGG